MPVFLSRSATGLTVESRLVVIVTEWGGVSGGAQPLWILRLAHLPSRDSSSGRGQGAVDIVSCGALVALCLPYDARPRLCAVVVVPVPRLTCPSLLPCASLPPTRHMMAQARPCVKQTSDGSRRGDDLECSGVRPSTGRHQPSRTRRKQSPFPKKISTVVLCLDVTTFLASPSPEVGTLALFSLASLPAWHHLHPACHSSLSDVQRPKIRPTQPLHCTADRGLGRGR